MASPGVWVFVVAAAVRLLALTLWPLPPLAADAADYHRLAEGLLAGQGFVGTAGLPTAERPPLYPLVLAGALQLAGGNLWGAYLLQALLDAGSCALVFHIGRRLFGIGPGLVAGALAAGYLSLVAATRLLLSETLFIFLLLLALRRLVSGPVRAASAAIAGALLGLATLTRGTSLLLPLACGLVLLRGVPARAGLRRAGLLLAAYALVLAPWLARNWVVFDAVVPVATQAGKVLYSSYRPPEGKIFGRYARDGTTAYAEAHLSEPEASRYFVGQTWAYVRRHPEVLPRLLLQKFGMFFVPLDWELLGAGAGVWNGGYVFIVPFAVWGAWVTRRCREGRWLWVFAGYFLAMSLVFYGSPRARLPVEPCLLMWAGAGMAALWAARPRHRLQLAAAGTYLSANLGLMWASQPVKQALAAALQRAGLW